VSPVTFVSGHPSYLWCETNEQATHMLAEKFFLILETIISRTCPDGSSIVVSTSRHVPIKLPSKTG
jgi:hypothetical protein